MLGNNLVVGSVIDLDSTKKCCLAITYNQARAFYRASSVVRAFAHGAMNRRIDPSWGGAIELFLVPDSGPRLV